MTPLEQHRSNLEHILLLSRMGQNDDANDALIVQAHRDLVAAQHQCQHKFSNYARFQLCDLCNALKNSQGIIGYSQL